MFIGWKAEGRKLKLHEMDHIVQPNLNRLYGWTYMVHAKLHISL